MPHFDPKSSDCRIYTRRSGVLAAVGHDLEIVAGSYQVDLDEEPLRVRAIFDPRSLRVVGAVEGGVVVAEKLSAHDREEIERHIVDDVLEAARYPDVEFASTHVEPMAGGYRLRGQLRLHGTERSVELTARRRGEHTEAEVTIHQPDFGIRPFRALAGTLRVHPDVRVRVRLDNFAR